MKQRQLKARNIITDKLVLEKTGKSMEEWFIFLDNHGARKMEHSLIFELVSKTPQLNKLGLWNQNLLTTSYGWSRELRQRGQKENGFEISVSKTVLVPVSKLFNAWIDAAERDKWLGKRPIIFRKTTENKSARITWSDRLTSLSVDFYEKDNGKSQVVVQHQKIDSPESAADLKVFWTEKLNSMKQLLEADFS